jgi:uncharacterized membrane protein YedE/YeeE
MSITQHINLVLGLALLLGFGLGGFMQLTHFCTMGAMADIVLFKSFQRAKLFALTLAVALIGTQTLVLLKWININHTVYDNDQLLWLSHSLGGLCFGSGMVLAGGCVSKNLLRLGTGSLKALTVLTVVALSAAMTVRGIFSPLRTNGLDLLLLQIPNTLQQYFINGSNIYLNTYLNTYFNSYFNSYFNNYLNTYFIKPDIALFIVSLTIGLGLILWSVSKPDERTFKHCGAGLAIGSLIIMGWVLSGVLAYVPEHPDTLQEAFLSTVSNKMENILPVASLVSWLNYLLLFSDSSQVMTLAMAISLGMVLGSAAVCLYQKNFHWQGFSDSRDWAYHILGAGLMGFGGVLAMGCSISHGLGGLSVLSLSSLLTFIAIVLGAMFTLKYLEQ